MDVSCNWGKGFSIFFLFNAVQIVNKGIGSVAYRAGCNIARSVIIIAFFCNCIVGKLCACQLYNARDVIISILGFFVTVCSFIKSADENSHYLLQRYESDCLYAHLTLSGFNPIGKLSADR